MATAGFFEREDSPHGLAKRVILFRYLQQKIASALQTQEEFDGYNYTHFDAFCGTGMYSSPVGGHPTCPFPIEYGSPLVALHALCQIFRRVGGDKTSLFIFEDKNADYVEELKKNVRKVIKDFNGSESNLVQNDCLEFRVFRGRSCLRVTILFLVCQFRRLPSLQTPIDIYASYTPMTSFIDPFGFSHTPMNEVVKFIGLRRDVILFFGVESINRFQGVLEQQSNLNELMGCNNWRDFLPINVQSLSIPDKMRAYLAAYKECLKLRMSSVKTCNISMRRGSKNGPDKSFIYDLIFISLDLKSLARMKYAMGVGCQSNEVEKDYGTELYFSDYQYVVGSTWAPINNQQWEGDEIYKAFKNGEIPCDITFGQLKEWILLETPFQIHSDVLLKLERKNKLAVINSHYQFIEGGLLYIRNDERKRKSFPAEVGISCNDPDDPLHKYRNAWMLQFSL